MTRTLVIPGLIVVFGAIGASPCVAQTRVTSVEELRRELAAGDFVIVVPAGGQPVAGRLMRLGTVDLDVRLVNKRTSQDRRPRNVVLTVPLDDIRSLERPRDAARNGAAMGAGIGAGFGAAMFVHAMAIDRNEMDEWATLYIGAAAVCTGIGALIRGKNESQRAACLFTGSRDRGRGVTVTIAFQPRARSFVTGSFPPASDLP